MISFETVESAKNEEKTGYKSVKGGIQDLTITTVIPVTSSKGTPGIEVTFRSEEADASFPHKFWLSGGALPRVQYLMEKFTGSKITDSFADEHEAAEKLGAKLVGTTKRVVVDEVKRNSKDGKFVNTYPDLRFAGFVEPEGEDAKVRVTDETANKPAAVGEINLEPATLDTSGLPF